MIIEEIPEVCRWCRNSTITRRVWENYICNKCEKKEREAGRSLIPTSPVKNAYFILMNDLGEKIE